MKNRRINIRVLFTVAWMAATSLLAHFCNAQVDDDTAFKDITIAPPAEDSAYYEDEEEQKDYEFEFPTQPVDSISWRNLSKAFIDSIKKDKDFDYVKNGIAKPKPIEKKEKAAPFVLSKLILYFAIFVFVAFLIWYLIDSKILVFKRKSKPVKNNEEAEEIAEDIFSIQYKQAIQKALANKNYRLAIRLQYLQLLKTMADKKMINYRPDKTNFDYLMQLRPTEYYNEFFNVTRNYEYSWYGLFNINEQQYEKMEQGFDDFFKRVQ